MKILVGILTTLVSVSAVAGSVSAKSMHKAKGKMVPMEQAAICHMYFTPSQAKKYAYACPISKGTMHKVMVSPAMEKMQMAKTNKELMSMNKKPMKKMKM